MTKDNQEPTVDSLAVMTPGLPIKAAIVEGIKTTYGPWTNWAGNQSCQPERTFHPRTLTDLETIVRLARENDKKIRCVGTGHSWSSVSMTSDYMVSTQDMNNIQAPVKGDDGWTVTIETGVTIDELDLYLRRHDPPLCLTSNVLVGEIRYGGILSLGCHGASLRARTMSDLITEIQIVNGLGGLVTYSEANGSEEFNAACVNLGLLGMIYTATLKVELMQIHMRVMDSCPRLSTIFGLNILDDTMRKSNHSQQALAKAGANLKDRVMECDAFELFYCPTVRGDENKAIFNDHIWLKQWERTNDPVTTEHEKQNDQERFLTRHYQDKQDHQLVMKHPFAESFQVGQQVLEVPEAIHFAFGDGNPMTFLDVGLTLKADNDFANVIDAFASLVEMTNDLASRSPELPSPALEARFIHGSNKMMSPAYDEDPDAIFCNINVIGGSFTPDFEKFAGSVLNDIMRRYNAKAHWGKLWEMGQDMHRALRLAYGDRLDRFDKVRQVQDPNNMFVNATFEKLLHC